MVREFLKVVLVAVLLFGACAKTGDFADSTAPAETTAPATATPVSSPTVAPSGSPAGTSLVLGSGGVEAIDFGNGFASSKSELEKILGKTDQDTGTLPSGQTEWGVCPGDNTRGIRWGTFFAVFTDGETDYSTERELHFFYYTYSDAYEQEPVRKAFSAKTAEGVGRGDKVSDLKAAYGAKLKTANEEPFGATWSVSESPKFLGGHLQGTDNNSRVSSVDGGSPCGE